MILFNPLLRGFMPLSRVNKKVKLATLVEGDPKAPVSIATSQRCKGGSYSFPWIAPLYPWYLPYNAECLARPHQVLFFEYLGWLDLGLKPGLRDHYATWVWIRILRSRSPALFPSHHWNPPPFIFSEHAPQCVKCFIRLHPQHEEKRYDSNNGYI